ncbi:unnamed protein product [Trichobilharzia regenti]|nr:unnamed protein product [Trichobilharzia regenti]
MAKSFLSLPLEKYYIKPKPSRTIFVLHCEFSSKRAPELFHLLRNHDRALNFSSYPALRYPQVYILRGGYAAFFRDYPELCEPPGYLQMCGRPELSSIWRKHYKCKQQKSTPKKWSRQLNSPIYTYLLLFTVNKIRLRMSNHTFL